jgi:ERCC4-type nuclease
MTITSILVDSREPPHIQELKFDGSLKMVTALEYGDLLVTTDDGEMICVERKTPSDLLASIGDNRLFTQLNGMKALTEWAYLVVTGSLTATTSNVNGIAPMTVADGRTTGWNYDSVWGALLTTQEMGVRVVFCANEYDYEDCVLRICKRRRGGEHIIRPVIDSREMTSGEKFLTSLPGIGQDKAAALLNEFNGKAADAFCWLTWHLWSDDVKIAGIGKGIKKGVRAAIGLDEGLVIQLTPDQAEASVTVKKKKDFVILTGEQMEKEMVLA